MTAIYGADAVKFPGSGDLPDRWYVSVYAEKANNTPVPPAPGYPSQVVFKAGDDDTKIVDLTSVSIFNHDRYGFVVYNDDGRQGYGFFYPGATKDCLWVYVENGKVCAAWCEAGDCPERKGKIELCDV